MFFRNSKKFFLLNIFLKPSAGLTLLKSGFIGSKVKRKPICETFPTIPIRAATPAYMNECLRMTITEYFTPPDTVLIGSSPIRSAIYDIREAKSSISIFAHNPTTAKRAIRHAVETISLEEQTWPLLRASRNFLGVGISVFSPDDSAIP